MSEDLKNFDFFALVNDIPGLNAEYAAEAVGDPALYKTVLHRCVRTLPVYLDALDESASAKDWYTFSIKIHGIKGLLRQIGHAQLSGTGEALEKAAKENDSAYCAEYYDGFKNELICLFEKIDALFKAENPDGTQPEKQRCDIADYTDSFAQIKAALEDFDSMLAAEILEPLTKIEFYNNSAEALITGAAQALDMFSPLKALYYIEEILKLCS